MAPSRIAALLAIPAGIILALAGTLRAGDDPTKAAVALKKGDHILFFGDSLTSGALKADGYVPLFREAIKKKHPDLDLQVSAVATGGHTVPDLLNRVDNDVIAKKPTIVVIQIGCNDARRIPKDTFKAGLEELIDRLHKEKIQVIQCSLTTVSERHDGKHKFDAKLEEFAQVARDVAKDTKVPLNDLRKAFMDYLKKNNPDNKDSGFLTYDGNHFNATGHQFVAEQMLKKFTLPSQDKDEAGWITLFDGKSLDGWKVKQDKFTDTKFVDEAGQVILGAKEAKVDQTLAVVDAKKKAIEGAKVGKVGGKDVPVDAEGNVIKGAQVVKVGGRTAIVDAKGKELKDAKKVQVTVANPMGGWKVDNGELTCGVGPRGTDLYTDKKFQDFELHLEFLGTANSGVYLQGRYEIQIDNSYGAKPKIEEKDGVKVEVFSKSQCGALYGQIAPSKNMAKKANEWQTYDIRFQAPRGDKGKLTSKAHVTLVWNGEKVIDADIPNGTALDPGPLLLQGDHGKVTFRNIKIKPLGDK